jgi:hypothetical protein
MQKRVLHGMTVQNPLFCDLYERLAGFYQSANALGAQHFLDFTAAFNQRDGLQIRTESPPCSLIRPWTVATKRSCFTTMRTLSHFSIPFSKTVLAGFDTFAIGKK